MNDHTNDASGSGRKDADLWSQFFHNMAEAWGMGLHSWQSFAGLGNVQDGPSFRSEADGLPRQWEIMREFYEEMMRRASDGKWMPEKQEFFLSQATVASPVLTQAGMLATASAMRYWSSLAELIVRYQSVLVKEAATTATTTDSENRVHADELRALLRGVGDAATKESRRLQYELELLGEAVARATDQATPQQEITQARRWHEVKP